MRLVKKPLINVLNEHLIDYPTPTTINYMSSFGFLLELSCTDTTAGVLGAHLTSLLLLLLLAPAGALGEQVPPTEVLSGPIVWPAEIVGTTEASFYEWVLLLQSI